MNIEWPMAIRKFLLNALLLVLSVAVSLAGFEVYLRLFVPRFQYAAEADFEFSAFRIKSRKPNKLKVRVHPDGGATHKVIYNDLALRQHRNIAKEDLEHTQVLAFFGDSFVENLRIPVHYSFTEVLDFLLNEQEAGLYTVLNFGVDGYGPDQSYLYYAESAAAKRASHVFYVFCSNDIRNIYEHGLFELNERGTLRHIPTTKPLPSAWLVSQLYVTYFALDVQGRLRAMLSPSSSVAEYEPVHIPEEQIRSGHRRRSHDATADQIEEDFVSGRWHRIRPYMDTWLAILARWEREIIEQGARFHVVLLPRGEEGIAESLLRDRFSVIDLYQLLRKRDAAYSYDELRFAKDRHWNEIGNLLSAIALFKEIAGLLNIPVPTEEAIGGQLANYFAAFEDHAIPAAFEKHLPPHGAEGARGHEIRAKYIALELE